MNNRIVFSLSGNEDLGARITTGIHATTGEFETRFFPDGETYLRVVSDVRDYDVFVVCTLHQPNDKIVLLNFMCKLLKDLGANSICLITPYLAYMRQDKQFNTGEAITSQYFANLLSSFVDRIITVDPHLHRRISMNEIYTVECTVLHAAPLISAWIKQNVLNALLIGPDSESEQWVSGVAAAAGVPFIVLEKIRHGDIDVEVSEPHIQKFKEYTPVLVDDIISTAHTMIESVEHLLQAGMRAPICIGVHAVFANSAYEDLRKSGASAIISCTTILHESNRIDVAGLIISTILR